jgi:Glycosyltransferase family 87
MESCQPLLALVRDAVVYGVFFGSVANSPSAHIKLEWRCAGGRHFAAGAASYGSRGGKPGRGGGRFCDLGLALHGKGRTILPPLLRAFAAALKPTVALPFLLFFAVRKQWTTLAFTGVAGLAMFLMAQARMSASGTHWFASFVSVNHGMFSPGGLNDFSSTNPIRFDLVNIQVVMSQLVASPQLTQYLSIGVALVALLAWWRLRQSAPEQSLLLDLAMASVISLLPVYHRFCDVALIVFPVAWAITEWRGALSRYAWVSEAAAIPFLVPGAPLLSRIAHSSAAVEELSKSWWWNLFIAPHQVWLVVAMLMTLLLAQGKLRPSTAKVSSALAAEAA